MAGKFQLITELYAEAAGEVSRDREAWKGFLTSAGFNYRLRFDEQLLIYAQRPDASAVLEMEKWNVMFRRWVNRGAKGIAVFDDSDQKSSGIRYYFDISDTHEGKDAVRVPVWSMKAGYEQEVIDALVSAYGSLENAENIYSAVISAGEKAAEESYGEYFEMLRSTGEENRLADLGTDDLRVAFRTLISESVSYMIGKRLGIDMPETEYDFEDLGIFDTVESLNILGFAVSDTAEQGLSEIAKTIRSLERKDRTFARQDAGIYNAEKEEDEGRKSDEHNIYEGRGSDDPGSGAFGGADGSSGDMGDQEEELPEGGVQTSLLQHDDFRTAGSASGRDAAGGRGDDGAALSADGRAGARHRGPERGRSDEVDSPDEQHQSIGGGDSKERTNTDLENRGAEADDLPLFSFARDLRKEETEQESAAEGREPVSLPEHQISGDAPEELSGEKKNYQIYEDPQPTGKKQRFRQNIEAIRLLKMLEAEGWYAEKGEQEILAGYAGWGGIPEAFDPADSRWSTEYEELKQLLTEEEYTAARESTLTAFYTPKAVTDAVYKVLSQMGFKGGNILEPSCGIGNFLGVLPESMTGSRFYGVELDRISGNIARQLYQKESITIGGFEDADLPDSFFDAAVGNVPFGDFRVSDKIYDRHKWLIHDYFFGKALDKVRAGGVIAFVTSKGTMDKKDPSVRRYLAQRAELLGAVRIPNDTFSKNAGTEVTSDIIFLQKRERQIIQEPDWVYLDRDENGIEMNRYFIDHPEKILGNMQMISGRFGEESACIPFEGKALETLLSDAVLHIHGRIDEKDIDLQEAEDFIPADPEVTDFSYTIKDGTIYFRENSRMYPVKLSETAAKRAEGLIGIRTSVRRLIELQTDGHPDEEIRKEQENLSSIYDAFTKEYGLINSRANSTVFSQDSSYYLLAALEVIDENGKIVRKADMFTKRTIKPHEAVQHCDTASEALAVSMGEKGHVDMEYMMQLTGLSEDKISEALSGVIFYDPKQDAGSGTGRYLAADEYLSGNVREKLKEAELLSKTDPRFLVNRKSLEQVQPKELSAGEISVRLGASWLPPDVVSDFMFELLSTPSYMRWKINVRYSAHTGEWTIEGKSNDRGNVRAGSTYGSSRMNAYKIIEETLNLRDVRIFDYIEDDEGRKKAVLNKKETAIVQGKQESINNAFKSWVWEEPERRERLTRIYNEKFNSIRPREYDGSHIIFSGMNPEITLRKHQRDAAARIIYGGNTLLAHVVGAGKTFEMAAAAMEGKRLGLCSKAMFVVPNHLTEQWAAEFLQLYPAANILVATKKDFQTKNRKKFCARIATGQYDAVIIGHSQFEKIPISIERQQEMLRRQIDEITEGIAELKRTRGERFSIKAMEKSKKQLRIKLEKLSDRSRKDDVICFEELGVDRLFIDESHFYKNLFLYTKMRNVGGIAQTEAQKSSDLFMKCRYLDEITGGKGIVFATGTPISNSMTELYTVQRYLQHDTLCRYDLQHFDAWASTFGETVTAVELAPEGTGYRTKTRFSRFYNLPELMNIFKEVADIKTSDMLRLPVPEARYHTVSVKPSEFQKKIVEDLSLRADRVRNGMVDATQDNMLKITNDGRKLAMDQRLISENLPDHEGSKVNVCISNICRIWEESREKKSAQLVFCDISTPKNDGSFNVYDDIRTKLIAKGIPAEEIRFIHEADSDVKKKALFSRVRAGEVRVLIGSTQKMGAGTNVQKRLIALHDLDCPWRPSDLEQRAGRIVRQGNENKEADIYRYVTEETFDAYLYQLVENKQKFISQIMTSKSPVRTAEDIDEASLSYAEIKMLATGNPHIKEKMDLDIQVARLRLLKQNFLSEKYALQDRIVKYFPAEIKSHEERIAGYEEDISYLKEQEQGHLEENFMMEIKGKSYTEKTDAGEVLLSCCKEMKSPEPVVTGSFWGFEMSLSFDTFTKEYAAEVKHHMRYRTPLGTDARGNISRIENLFSGIEKRKNEACDKYENILKQYENAKVEVKKSFEHEQELTEKEQRLAELDAMLNMDKDTPEIIEGEQEQKLPEKKERELQR